MNIHIHVPVVYMYEHCGIFIYSLLKTLNKSQITYLNSANHNVVCGLLIGIGHNNRGFVHSVFHLSTPTEKTNSPFRVE